MPARESAVWGCRPAPHVCSICTGGGRPCGVAGAQGAQLPLQGHQDAGLQAVSECQPLYRVACKPRCSRSLQLQLQLQPAGRRLEAWPAVVRTASPLLGCRSAGRKYSFDGAEYTVEELTDKRWVAVGGNRQQSHTAGGGRGAAAALPRRWIMLVPPFTSGSPLHFMER